jgi:hypothetical protein
VGSGWIDIAEWFSRTTREVDDVVSPFASAVKRSEIIGNPLTAAVKDAGLLSRADRASANRSQGLAKKASEQERKDAAKKGITFPATTSNFPVNIEDNYFSYNDYKPSYKNSKAPSEGHERHPSGFEDAASPLYDPKNPKNASEGWQYEDPYGPRWVPKRDPEGWLHPKAFIDPPAFPGSNEELYNILYKGKGRTSGSYDRLEEEAALAQGATSMTAKEEALAIIAEHKKDFEEFHRNPPEPTNEPDYRRSSSTVLADHEASVMGAKAAMRDAVDERRAKWFQEHPSLVEGSSDQTKYLSGLTQQNIDSMNARGAAAEKKIADTRSPMNYSSAVETAPVSTLKGLEEGARYSLERDKGTLGFYDPELGRARGDHYNQLHPSDPSPIRSQRLSDQAQDLQANLEGQFHPPQHSPFYEPELRTPEQIRADDAEKTLNFNKQALEDVQSVNRLIDRNPGLLSDLRDQMASNPPLRPLADLKEGDPSTLISNYDKRNQDLIEARRAAAAAKREEISPRPKPKVKGDAALTAYRNLIADKTPRPYTLAEYNRRQQFADRMTRADAQRAHEAEYEDMAKASNDEVSSIKAKRDLIAKNIYVHDFVPEGMVKEGETLTRAQLTIRKQQEIRDLDAKHALLTEGQ